MSPGKKLKEFVISYIQETKMDEFLQKEIPKKWEKYGDFVLFDERTFSSDVWKNQGDQFWMKICEILQCKRIGLKNKIKSDDYRSPNVTILFGNDPWILHRDNSITYTWHVEKCMFSVGNINEKIRIANLNCENEVVVDLFAGIGYFTLPFLVHARASHVHACEWNPGAVECLKRNLVLNKVQNRCTVHEGDSRLVCPKNIANRINLGLIPSSESHWKVACEALVEDGGVLHIHENVETKKDEISCQDCSILVLKTNLDSHSKSISINSRNQNIEKGLTDISWKHKQWLIKGVHILHKLISFLNESEKSSLWHCSIEKVNFVKSYAPHVNHLVYDVKIENKNVKEHLANSGNC